MKLQYPIASFMRWKLICFRSEGCENFLICRLIIMQKWPSSASPNNDQYRRSCITLNYNVIVYIYERGYHTTLWHFFELCPNCNKIVC
jgi:hypothetical protein